jgi:hypothetical protein
VLFYQASIPGEPRVKGVVFERVLQIEPIRDGRDREMRGDLLTIYWFQKFHDRLCSS